MKGARERNLYFTCVTPHLLRESSNKYILSTRSLPDSVLSIRNTKVDKLRSWFGSELTD